ncbi:hypothetical protein ACLOJK_016387 [Asimina triloba]
MVGFGRTAGSCSGHGLVDVWVAHVMGVMLVGVDLCWIEEMLVEDEDGSADLGSLAVAGSVMQVTVAGELATLAKGQHRSLACCCLGRDVVWCGQASVGSIMAVEIWSWLLGDEDGSDSWKFNGKWAAVGYCGRRLVGDGAGANGTLKPGRWIMAAGLMLGRELLVAWSGGLGERL